MDHEVIFVRKVIFIIGLLILAGCAQQESITPTGEVKSFDIIARQFEFDPGTIEVNAGDTVELHLKSEDVTHGFRLAEFGINEELEPGKEVGVTFVADKKGTFRFYCSVP